MKRADESTVKVSKTTRAQLHLVRRGAGFPTVNGLIEHLLRIAHDRPELLREGRHA